MKLGYISGATTIPPAWLRITDGQDLENLQPWEAIAHLQASPCDVVVISLPLEGGRAEDLLENIQRIAAHLPVIIHDPQGTPADAVRFVKVTRTHPKGAAVLSISAQLPVAGGRVSGVRIAYNGMGPAPLRAKSAERALEGRSLDAAGIAPALAAAAEGTAPVDDAIASAWWRREILPIHLRRLLLGAGHA